MQRRIGAEPWFAWRPPSRHLTAGGLNEAPPWRAGLRSSASRSPAAAGRLDQRSACAGLTGSLRGGCTLSDLHSGLHRRSWSITGMAPALSAGRNFVTGPPSIRPSESNELCSGALCEVASPVPARSKAGDSCARRLIGLTDEPLIVTQAHLVCQWPADPKQAA